MISKNKVGHAHLIYYFSAKVGSKKSTNILDTCFNQTLIVTDGQCMISRLRKRKKNYRILL
jgi:hypothetical protein